MSELPASPTTIQEFKEVYSPGTLLGVYAAAIRSGADGRMILARGIYEAAANQKEYGGYYYDSIRSPHENKSIRTRIPAIIRSKLDNRQIYTFKGYIEKKINFSAIELVFVVDDVLQKEENQFSAADIQRLELIRRKTEKGYRDAEAFIKKIYKGELIKIANLYGSTAIVDKDFYKGLGEASLKFAISDYRCNFSSKTALLEQLTILSNQDFDIIALVRGGGEKASLELFNDPETGEAALATRPILVSALGHTVDDTLLDRLADKKFALPHDYGNSLKVWVDQASEEQAQSKSLFIEQVKQDLSKTFHGQITALEKQLQTRNQEFEVAQQKFKELAEQSSKEKQETLAAKEKTFEANLMALQEQVKNKEELLQAIQKNYEKSARNQTDAARAELKAQIEILKAGNQHLANQAKQGAGQTVWMYLLFAILLGLLLGYMIK